MQDAFYDAKRRSLRQPRHAIEQLYGPDQYSTHSSLASHQAPSQNGHAAPPLWTSDRTPFTCEPNGAAALIWNTDVSPARTLPALQDSPYPISGRFSPPIRTTPPLGIRLFSPPNVRPNVRHVAAASDTEIQISSVESPTVQSIIGHVSPLTLADSRTSRSAPITHSMASPRPVFNLPSWTTTPRPTVAENGPVFGEQPNMNPAPSALINAPALGTPVPPVPRVPDVQADPAADMEEALFNELDEVGKREVAEDDVRAVIARMNSTAPQTHQIDINRIPRAAFRKILETIDPTDFAGKEMLKGWLNSTGLLEALTEELDQYITRQGASRKEAIEVLRRCSDTDVTELCGRFHSRLFPVVSSAVDKLRSTSQTAYTAQQANEKFAMMDDAHTGSFADVAEFFKGLDGHIGLPSPRVLDMMYLEHVGSADSQDTFITTNYGGTETYPALEWEFVTNPDMSKTYPGRERRPTHLDMFLTHDTAIAAGLEKPEIIALRLFTGPMFMKYNAKLRNFTEEDVRKLKGNGYVTTIHAVVSGVIKLSRIWKPPPDRKVYRGLGGMVLPERFWKADEFGCRGGVEFALMSTTIKREVAMQYSGVEKSRPTIFEIEVGQVDRGASLSWVSQYPVEEEVVMPPLSNLEVVGDARMEATPTGLVMVIPLRINVNLKSLTMDELKDRRKQLHLSMVGNLFQEAQRDLTDMLSTDSNMLCGLSADPAAAAAALPANADGAVQSKVDGMLSNFQELMTEIQDTSSVWFNDDDNYKNAMTSALDMKRGTLRKFLELNSPRMRQVSAEVQQRIRDSNCADWARDGTVYRIIASTNAFPWEAVAEGKVKEVELLPHLTEEQAAVAWEALAANSEMAQHASGPPEVEAVAIRGLDGKLGKVKTAEALLGESFAMTTERIGIDGVRIQEVQGLGSDGVRLLLPLFRMNQSLVKIDLSRSTMSAQLAKDLAGVLKDKTNLRVVKIRGTIYVDQARQRPSVDMASKRVTGHVRRNSLLRNGFVDPGASGRFAKRPDALKRIRRLSVQGPGPDEGWEPCDVEGGIVLSAIISGNNALTKLDLSGNHIGPEGATALGEVLDGRRLALLDLLNLRDNNICAQGATALSAALRCHTVLRCLDVRDNRTGASGPVELAPAISANQDLQELNGVQIVLEAGGAARWLVRHVTDPAYEMVFVRGRIMQMVDVFRLDLADCQLGREGARLLRSALMARSCAGLRELVLCNNALRAAGACEIAPALSGLRALEMLDLSYNLIQDEGTEAVAQALSGHAALRRLVYVGNIAEGLVEFDVCCPRFREPYRQIASAIPRAHVKFFSRSRVRQAVGSWCMVVLSFLALCTGIFGAPIAFADNQYIYGFGILGIGVFGLLGVSWWVLWTGVQWRLGFVSLFVKIVQRREAERLRQEASERLRLRSGNSSRRNSTESMREMHDAPRSPGENRSGNLLLDEHSRLPYRLARASGSEHDTGVAASGVLTLENEEAHSHPMDDSRDAQDEEDLQNVLGERLTQQVPMLLDQYVHNTTHPASLDQQLIERDEDIKRYWTVGTFFHSPTPLALALRRHVVKWVLGVFVLYFGGMFGFFLWPYIYGHDFTFRTFRIVVHQYRDGGIALAGANIESLSIAALHCATDYLNAVTSMQSVNNTVVLEYEYPVNVGRWRMTSSTVNDPAMDPKRFELQGCSEKHARCEEWESITGNLTDRDFPEERGEDKWYDLVEDWQQTLLRFVPFVFAAGFLALLYCSLSNRQRYGRAVLSTTFAICSLMYIISTHPHRVTEQRIRWVSGGSLSFMPLMLLFHERMIIPGVVLYGVIYCPMVAVLFFRIYQAESLPQWSRSVGIRNYDQLTVMPMFVIANCLVIPMIIRYCYYRAKTKVLILADIKDYNKTWERLQKAEPEALKDLKGEIDKINSAIDRCSRVSDAVVRHRVFGSTPEVGEQDMRSMRRLGSLRLRRTSSSKVLREVKSERHDENKISSLWQVYAQATGLEVLLRSKVQSWALLTRGGFYSRRGDFVRWEVAKDEPRLQRRLAFERLKETARAIEKVIRFYDGDVSRLLDICRQQIVFESVEDISHCLATIRQDSEVQVVRAKSRMDPDSDQHKVYGGYRDVALNLRFRTEEAELLGIDGHVCEVRLVHIDFANMLQGQDGRARHNRYVEYRTARGL